MAMQFLRNLFSGKGSEGKRAPPQDAVDYKGYSIEPTPRRGQGGWTTEGIIRKEIEGEARSQHFIRADTSMSIESAVEYSISKGKKIIDEQGDRLFTSG